MSDDNTMDSVMIDLETMATGPNAGVIQVGAIPFNSRTGLAKPDLFEVDVDLHSALMLGGEVDASTVQFWRDQGGLQPKRPPKAMRSALTDLARWLGKYPDLKRVWAQGRPLTSPFLRVTIAGRASRSRGDTPCRGTPAPCTIWRRSGAGRSRRARKPFTPAWRTAAARSSAS